VGGRFFQGLKQCVKGVDGNHVNFVDYYDLVRGTYRRIFYVLVDLSDVFHRRVRRSIDLLDIYTDSVSYLETRRAFAARIGLVRWSFAAVEGFGEDPGHSSLADPPYPTKEKRVGDTARNDRIGKRLDNVVLADYVAERSRPVFAGEYQIRGHLSETSDGKGNGRGR
jgi:hypothetical protein